jgi:hypothetical protein
MGLLAEREQRFWSKVWQCAHRRPCKLCCWPWCPTARHRTGPWAWKEHFSYTDVALTDGKSLGVHRIAYTLAHKTLLLRGITVCHQCFFSPCCNPSHLRVGTQSDNGRDNRGKDRYRNGYPPVRLPDGQLLLGVSTDWLLKGDKSEEKEA